MTAFKTINGHSTTMGAVRAYLYYGSGSSRKLGEDGRPVDRSCAEPDFFNLMTSEIDRWDMAMDATRAESGNNRSPRHKQTITYRHFIISPDPGDGCPVSKLKELVRRWVDLNFADEGGKYGAHQVAVVYHDDNSQLVKKGMEGILHAHVVVNNTNLDTGKRLMFDEGEWLALAEDLQAISKDLGLSHFATRAERIELGDEYERILNAPVVEEGKHIGEGKRKFDRRPSKQDVYRAKAEREIRAKGEKSWKDELRDAIDVACHLSRDMGEFRANLEKMGIHTEERKRKNDNKHDLIFYYPQPDVPLEQNKRRVGGARLGAKFTNPAIEGKMKESYYRNRLSADCDAAAAGIANLVSEVTVVRVKRGAEVETVDISRALAAIQGDRIHTVEEARATLALARSRLAKKPGDASRLRHVENLEALIKVAKVTNILPPDQAHARSRAKDWCRREEEAAAAKSGERVSLDRKVDRGWHLTDEEKRELKRNPAKYSRWRENFINASEGRTGLLRGGGGRKGGSTGGDGGGRSHGGGEARSRSRSR